MIVQGYCDRLGQELEGSHPLRPYVEQIHQAAERSAALAGRGLAFSRRRAIEREPVALGEVVRDLAKTLRQTLGEAARPQKAAPTTAPRS
ncbi:MAG: hypothetical protein R6X20_01465 [Phycisphaerae bacterium]